MTYRSLRALASCLLILTSFPSAFGQPPTLDVVGNGIAGYGSVKFIDPANLGKKRPGEVEYGDVRGKYLWDNDWHPGLLVFKNNHGLKIPQVRLNTYTQDIHYVGADGVEMVADKGLLKELLLYSEKDSMKTIGYFQMLRAADSKTEQFFEILNTGKIKLLKRAVAGLKKLPYDPSVGKTEYRFSSTINYFIQDPAIKPLSSLNKTALLNVIKPEPADEEWLAQNKSKLKSEAEVVAYLNYLNGKVK